MVIASDSQRAHGWSRRAVAVVMLLSSLGAGVLVTGIEGVLGVAGASTLTAHHILDGSILSLRTSQHETAPPGESAPIGGVGSGNISIDSFSWGVLNTSANCRVSRCAGSVGRADMGPLKLSRVVDQISTVFLRDCVQATRISKVTLYIEPPNTGSGRVLGDAMKVDFTNVIITADQWSGDSGGRPTETLSMTYKSYRVTYHVAASPTTTTSTTTTSTTSTTSTTTTTTTTTTPPPPPPVTTTTLLLQ